MQWTHCGNLHITHSVLEEFYVHAAVELLECANDTIERFASETGSLGLVYGCSPKLKSIIIEEVIIICRCATVGGKIVADAMF